MLYRAVKDVKLKWKGESMPQHDLRKCQEAWELRNQGLSFKIIGKLLGVSEQRASEMQKTWQYHIELEEAKADLAAFRSFLYERT